MRKEAFTIVELLVVIAIIGLLLTLLLPSMDTAREATRRVQCMSNMRQMYQYFYAYQNERLGWLPMESSYTYSGNPSYSPSSQDDDWSSNGVSGSSWGATGWAIMLNGNAAQPAGYSGGYVEPIPFKLAVCPSSDILTTINVSQGWPLSYGYRNNSSRLDFYNYGTSTAAANATPQTYYGRDALNDPLRNWRPLITDAAGYRRSGIGIAPYTRTINTSAQKWSHIDGGNYLRHDGAAKWVLNSNIYPGRAGWPWTGTVVAYGWATSASPEVDAGLDQIFRNVQ